MASMAALASFDILSDYIYEKLTLEQWLKKGKSIFGSNRHDWKFLCPSCKQGYNVDPKNEVELLSQASICQNCQLSTARGLFTDVILQIESRIEYIFPFAKKEL